MGDMMLRATIGHLPTKTVSIERNTMVNGKTAAITVCECRCTPIVFKRHEYRIENNRAVQVLETFVIGDFDIRNGDILCDDTRRRYSITAAKRYEWDGETYYQLILELAK